MKNELEIFLEQFDKLTLDSRQISKKSDSREFFRSVTTIAKISIDGRTFPVDKPLTLMREHDGKFVEVEIRNSQGVGTTCKVKLEESNE